MCKRARNFNIRRSSLSALHDTARAICDRPSRISPHVREAPNPNHEVSTKLQLPFLKFRFSFSRMNRNINILFVGLLLLLPALIFTSIPIGGGSFMTSLLSRVQLLRNHLQVPSSILRVFGANMSVSPVQLRLSFSISCHF